MPKYSGLFYTGASPPRTWCSAHISSSRQRVLKQIHPPLLKKSPQKRAAAKGDVIVEAWAMSGGIGLFCLCLCWIFLVVQAESSPQCVEEASPRGWRVLDRIKVKWRGRERGRTQRETGRERVQDAYRLKTLSSPCLTCCVPARTLWGPKVGWDKQYWCNLAFTANRKDIYSLLSFHALTRCFQRCTFRHHADVFYKVMPQAREQKIGAKVVFKSRVA